MRILVTGGSGYIGSHTVVQLVAAGHDVVIADDFSRSKRTVLGRLGELCGEPVDCHTVNLTDRDLTKKLFEQGSFDAVMHFAGLKAVGESVSNPLDYYSHNLVLLLSVLAAMRDTGVTKFVFSSSATVYGEHASVPMREDMPTSATNPYGWTKVMQEQILRDIATAAPDMRIALLRYFNPVGAHPSGLIGEDPHGVPNNLMPLLAEIAVGQRDHLNLFGDDYPTPDGTARRDYLHVEDLAAGHIAALEALNSRGEPISAWNLGTGTPTSVRELVAAFEEACGRPIPTVDAARRPGDIAESFADPAKAQTELGWKATRTIQDMCADTWRWRSTNPTGYPVG